MGTRAAAVASASLPALLNRQAGSAARARAMLEADGRFRTVELEPARIAEAVRAEAARGTRRLLVCGGDGTLSAAFGAAADTSLEIAVFPGGTLNHFARDRGLPLDPARALDLAINGTAKPVDLGYVNGHPILNTSSVGVYVDFVARRERFERWVGYAPASVAAAMWVWRRPRPLLVDMTLHDGARRRLRTPLLLVGVGERDLRRSALGAPKPGGRRALDVLVVNEHTQVRMRALAFRAAAQGIDGLISEDQIACQLTPRAVVTLDRDPVTVAIDGELVSLSPPLEYQFVPDAVNVVRE